MLILYLITTTGYCQTIGKKMDFVNYLIDNSLYKEAIIETKNVAKDVNLSLSQKDTINYLLGKSYLNINQDSALLYFNRISENNTIYFNDSRFYSSFILFSRKEFVKGLDILAEVNAESSEEKCNKEFFNLAGLTLQNKGIDILENQDCNYILFQSLNKNQQRLKSIKNKSPFIAGFLSFAVPGLGKVYSGKSKQAVVNFFMVSALGYQAFEAYKIGGVNDARFVVYSSLFSIFHVANVWGSVLSIKLTKQETYDEIHHNVIATIRIPIDDIFIR